MLPLDCISFEALCMQLKIMQLILVLLLRFRACCDGHAPDSSAVAALLCLL